VAITANTVYVVSYLAPNGHYTGEDNYFSSAGIDNAPLHALRDGESGANGLYVYGTSVAFPTQTYRSENYWVDVVFATSVGGDTTPPTVTSSTPANGATGVATGTTVTATFSEAMDANTIGGSTFELRTTAGGALVSATVSYNATTRVATLTPGAALTAGTGYTAIVKGGATGAKDSAGNALAADVSWAFTTGAADTTPPTVTSTAPASGATGVATNSAVTATFSEAMDATTISGGTFELRDSGGTLVTATVTYNATTRVASLTPSAALAGSTTYTATVRGGTTDPRVKDSAGNALATNATWSFTTVALDLTPPTVTANTPASGATGVSGTANMTATFSEAMDATTISTTTFELRNASNAVVAAAVTYNATTRVATLNPTPTLTAGATYTATVKGGATDPRVKDAAGNALAANFAWSFTILPDTTAPTVTATSPTSGATGVSRTANITATFSEAMNPTTISTSTFVLRDAGNNVIPAAVTINGANTVATLNPTATLAAGTTFTVTVQGGAAGVKDQAGNALVVDRVWSFTTVVDNTAPTVTTTSPAAGATGVSRTANITATFSEEMNPTTISTTTFVLRDAGNNVIPAAVTINGANTVATLNPTPTLAALTTFTVTVLGGATGVKDQAGNALAVDRVWSFTTR
jgi:methionine-rich copper-binding protein CopC